MVNSCPSGEGSEVMAIQNSLLEQNSRSHPRPGCAMVIAPERAWMHNPCDQDVALAGVSGNRQSSGIVPAYALCQLVEEFLLALVRAQAGLLLIALNQLAQAFQARIALLPDHPHLVQVVAMPGHALALLADGGFQLGKKT